MSCCIELVQITPSAPLVTTTAPAPVIRLRSITSVITGATRAALVVPRVTIPLIGGQASTGGTGGGGPSTTRWEILTTGTQDFIWVDNDLVYVERPV